MTKGNWHFSISGYTRLDLLRLGVFYDVVLLCAITFAERKMNVKIEN